MDNNTDTILMVSKTLLLLAVVAAAAALVAAQQTTPTITFLTFMPGYAVDLTPMGGGYIATPTWVISQVLKDRDIPFDFLQTYGDDYDSDASMAELLDGYQVFLLNPPYNAGPMPSNFLRPFITFVEAGGVLVWIANPLALNGSFEWGWESSVSNKDFEKTDEAATEGPFAKEGPATLTRLDNMEAVSNWEGEGVVCYYAAGKDCAVLSVSMGEGFLVYLGANYTSNEGEINFRREEERDLVTEDWEEVLALAVVKFAAPDEEESESQASESSESESSAAETLCENTFFRSVVCKLKSQSEDKEEEKAGHKGEGEAVPNSDWDYTTLACPLATETVSSVPSPQAKERKELRRGKDPLNQNLGACLGLLFFSSLTFFSEKTSLRTKEANNNKAARRALQSFSLMEAKKKNKMNKNRVELEQYILLELATNERLQRAVGLFQESAPPRAENEGPLSNLKDHVRVLKVSGGHTCHSFVLEVFPSCFGHSRNCTSSPEAASPSFSASADAVQGTEPQRFFLKVMMKMTREVLAQEVAAQQFLTRTSNDASSSSSSCLSPSRHQHSFFAEQPNVDALKQEEYGLDCLRLASAGQFIVPKVLASGPFLSWNNRGKGENKEEELEQEDGRKDADAAAFILLEYVPIHKTNKKKSDRRRFARTLAAMHQSSTLQLHSPKQEQDEENEEGMKKAKGFGFPYDNYLSVQRQENRWNKDWIDFFLHQRFRPQLARLATREQLYTRHYDLFLFGERVLTHAERLMLGEGLLTRDAFLPCLLHGDIGAADGNWAVQDSGSSSSLPEEQGIVLFDPAPFYGHHEFESCFLPPTPERREYEQLVPPLPGAERRRVLYQFYHALYCMNVSSHVPRMITNAKEAAQRLATTCSDVLGERLLSSFGSCFLPSSNSKSIPPSLQKLKAPQDPMDAERNVVLYLHGSFSPVHYNHMLLLQAASGGLEEHHNKEVLGCFMAPMRDYVLRGKFKTTGGDGHIPLHHREAMLLLATYDEYNETSAPLHLHQHRIALDRSHLNRPHDGLALQRLLEQQNGWKCTVIYVCGADQLLNTQQRLDNRYQLCCVRRKAHGSEMLSEEWMKENLTLEQRQRTIIVEEGEYCPLDLSSTELRRRLAREEYESLVELTPPSVVAYLRQHNIKQFVLGEK
ncbi:protein-ribulosamine 3-kinase [Balamuthia mandrillaris]